MAPIEPNATDQAEIAIRDTIQALYNIMLHTSAYDAAGQQTSAEALIAEVHSLSQGLGDVSSTALSGTPLPQVPRDLVQYVEAGRNPDIYTREFVELVRRTNQLRAGKRAAFASFQDALAGQIRTALPELNGDVSRILAGTTGLATEAVSRGGAMAAAPHAVSAVATNAVSASVSPHANNSNHATPSSDEHSVVDMLGMLPGTPQAAAAGVDAGAGVPAGAAGATGPDAVPKLADQDAMQTT